MSFDLNNSPTIPKRRVSDRAETMGLAALAARLGNEILLDVHVRVSSFEPGVTNPRFAPSQRGYVLSGSITTVSPSVPASAGRDGDDR